MSSSTYLGGSSSPHGHFVAAAAAAFTSLRGMQSCDRRHKLVTATSETCRHVNGTGRPTDRSTALTSDTGRAVRGGASDVRAAAMTCARRVEKEAEARGRTAPVRGGKAGGAITGECERWTRAGAGLKLLRASTTGPRILPHICPEGRTGHSPDGANRSDTSGLLRTPIPSPYMGGLVRDRMCLPQE